MTQIKITTTLTALRKVLGATRHRVMANVWRLASTMRSSRKLSGMFAVAVALGVAVILIHGGGLYGFVSNLGNMLIIWNAVHEEPSEHEPHRRQQP